MNLPTGSIDFICLALTFPYFSELLRTYPCPFDSMNLITCCKSTRLGDEIHYRSEVKFLFGTLIGVS